MASSLAVSMSVTRSVEPLNSMLLGLSTLSSTICKNVQQLCQSEIAVGALRRTACRQHGITCHRLALP
jgi:hypothetical protein